MINGMYLSTMGAMVQASRHASISNNLANANTSGFKPDFTIFRAVDAESVLQMSDRAGIDEILEQTGGGVWLERTYTDFGKGQIRETGNPLNAALEDTEPGRTSFFMVRGQDNETRYTRDGSFNLNSEGTLVNGSGNPVLDSNGGEIQVPEGARDIYVARDGTVFDGGNNEIGQIGVVSTADIHDMTKIGDNLFSAKDTAQFTPRQQEVRGGHIEDSGTSPIQEMANMIEASRIYESNMTFLRIQDEALGDTVSRIASLA